MRLVHSMAEVATTSFDVRDNDERMVNERLYEIYGTNNQNGKSDIMQHNDVSPIHTSFLSILISFLSICYLHNMQRIFIHIDQMILLPC